jgi:DNA-binding NtrC family response regulator
MARVLVLDDDKVQAWCMQLAFQSDGHEVRMCQTVDEVMEVCKTFSPEVFVTDQNLRDGCSGIEIAKMLEQRYPSLACIIVSGRPQADLRVLSEKLANVQIFEKPVDLSVLLNSVSSCLQR